MSKLLEITFVGLTSHQEREAPLMSSGTLHAAETPLMYGKRFTTTSSLSVRYHGTEL